MVCARLSTPQTLLMGHNGLTTVESVQHLLSCPSINTLDLQHNRIEDPAVRNVALALSRLLLPCVLCVAYQWNAAASWVCGRHLTDSGLCFGNNRCWSCLCKCLIWPCCTSKETRV